MNNPKYNIDKEIKKFAEFLKKIDLEEMGKEYERDERYMAAKRTVEDLTTDPKFIGYYDYENERKRELEEEKEYAREDGFKEGREEGIQEGKKEANIEMVKKLLSLDVEIEKIAASAELSIEEVEKIAISTGLSRKENN